VLFIIIFGALSFPVRREDDADRRASVTKDRMSQTCIYSPAAEHHRTLASTRFPRAAEDRKLSWPGYWYTDDCSSCAHTYDLRQQVVATEYELQCAVCTASPSWCRWLHVIHKTGSRPTQLLGTLYVCDFLYMQSCST